MERFRSILVAVVLLMLSVNIAEGEAWKDITGTISVSEDITCIEGVTGLGCIYVGTTGGVYVSRDGGETWARENVSAFGPRVTGIASLGGRVFVSSDEGFHIKEESRGQWTSVPGKRNLKGVCAYGEDGLAMTWCDDGVFLVSGGVWKDITPRAVTGSIGKSAVSGDTIYISTGGDVLSCVPRMNDWKRVSLVFGMAEDVAGNEANGEVYDGEKDAQNGALIKDITPIPGGGAVVSTGKGLYIMGDDGELAGHIDTIGLPASKVVTALSLGGGFLAATNNKVFFRPENTGQWKAVLESSDSGDIREMKSYMGSKAKRKVLAVFSRGIYVSVSSIAMLENFRFEEGPHLAGEQLRVGPDIKEVHRMAVEYAEVSPDKISGWRRAVKWRAILPRVSFGYDEDYNDNIEIYKSATQTYLVTGPRDKSDGWDITLTWDLPDLIWNPSQTSIDVRSKLMVQLRDDILEDVTRLYFERKRLIDEMFIAPEKDKTKTRSGANRIEELTAYIDAYTGGMFSRSLDSGIEM